MLLVQFELWGGKHAEGLKPDLYPLPYETGP